ncbi:transcription elongation factor A protein 3 isoform X23 [Salmo salar]|uniref:Transcription elongation factor A protein 3 isoform X23 n=1 Tax=Salmo salar TaxID=8030 RepID=A0A1S3RV42_SALSA|nr:transcription elongation factor A protein 3 isoform X23 [Salmo salar]|eukprot:XP_014055702.1 PREDICTED: transcription elongation factor A protein 3-like isoform X15 [Salmo salar]
MTREEELIRIAKKLDKMVSRNNTEGALDLLNELKGFNMTLKLLQETRIGMSVNGIRKHCTDDEVVSLAKILIKDWKRLLDAARTQSTERPNEMKNGVDSNKSTGFPVRSPLEKDTRRDSSDTLSPSHPRPIPPSRRPSVKVKKERKDSTDSKPSHSVKRHSTDSKSDRRDSVDSKTSNSPSAKKLSSETKEFHGSKSSHPGPLQRKSSTDSIERRGKPEMPKIPTTPTSPMSPSFSSAGVPLSPCLATGETIRDKCIEMLAAALRTDDNFKEFGTNCDSMAAEIEDHIYTEMGSTDMKYKNRVRSRISNLKDPKNPGLRRNVLAGGIELRRFAIMSAEEMASDELKQLRNNLTKEAIREHQLSKTSGTISDLFQCSKCSKKNCTYNQMQTRSADEPMTTFVLCNECGNRWKFC